MNKWHSEIWKQFDDGAWTGAMDGFISPGEFAELAGNPEYGPLFAYMYRRFGVPEFGSDDHKEIANWYITTPDENIMLCVSPRPSGPRYSFGYMLNRTVYNNPRNDTQIKAAETAIKTAMVDLCVPVFVRDIPINAAGRMSHNIDIVDEYPAFRWAGYGVDHSYFENEYGSKSKGRLKMFNKSEQWQQFSEEVEDFIEEYVKPQYGDFPDKTAEKWTHEKIQGKLEAYVDRIGKSSRGPEDALMDCLKIAHFSGYLYALLKHGDAQADLH